MPGLVTVNPLTTKVPPPTAYPAAPDPPPPAKVSAFIPGPEAKPERERGLKPLADYVVALDPAVSGVIAAWLARPSAIGRDKLEDALTKVPRVWRDPRRRCAAAVSRDSVAFLAVLAKELAAKRKPFRSEFKFGDKRGGFRVALNSRSGRCAKRLSQE